MFFISVYQPVGHDPIVGLGALFGRPPNFYDFVKINKSPIISYKYTKKKPYIIILTKIKGVNESKQFQKGYGGPPQCSYSSLEGRLTSNVENHCFRCFKIDDAKKDII